MELRPATLADLELLDSWDDDDAVVAATGGDGDMDWADELPRHVAWRQILLGTVDGRPVGVVVIIDPAAEETHYWGDVGPGLRAIDIWIGAAPDRGRGLGSQMMRQAIGRCFADAAVTAILIDPLASNSRAHRFDQRLGFRAVARRTFGTDDCLLHRLDRADWLATHC
jgi:aminoglycoside 6'-N-acetyltransferase